jgi:hypothetical protein
MSNAAPLTGEMRCPTCKARQEWSDTCRRCQSDLTLLYESAQAQWQLRRTCLLHLRAGHSADALVAARQSFSLNPSSESARLLAVCHLLCGHWDRALLLAETAGLFGERGM